MTITALDLFAGTGWGVACRWLGIEEKGVELMPEAVETRTANGMETIYRDVWDGILLTREEHEEAHGRYSMLIASPPCQTFSVAGGGAGRRALDEVIEAVRTHAYKDPARLLEFGVRHDMRTALVLTPLAYVHRDMPRLVAFEQVPTVLPVWEECAEIMRDLGYQVKTAILNAEQHGVPQTRRRAILVARLDGAVDLPVPTHSRYYPRTPDRLDEGVLPWVSMAQALGWGRTGAPSPTYCNSGHGGAGIEWGGNSVRIAMRAQSAAGEDWAAKPGAVPGTNDAIRVTPADAAAIQSYPARLRSNYGTGGDAANRGERTVDQPAPTLTSKADRNKWDTGQGLSAEEASALQTYERPFVWCGSRTKQFLQIGNAVPPLLGAAVLAALTEGA